MLFLFDQLEADIRIFISRGEITFWNLNERGVRWRSVCVCVWGGLIQFSQRLSLSTLAEHHASS